MTTLLLPIQQALALRDAAAATGLARELAPHAEGRAPFEAALVRELAKALEAADWIRVDLWVGLLMRWGWR